MDPKADLGTRLFIEDQYDDKDGRDNETGHQVYRNKQEAGSRVRQIIGQLQCSNRD